MSETIFAKIAAGSIPADIVHDDDRCLVFHDVAPQAPFHLLVIPRKPIVNVAALGPDDESLVGHMVLVAAQVARDLGITGGYRLVFNCGRDGGQSVDHLHLHLLAGRPLGWPPG
ncbi:MAG: histidine triad nucleotide-binding protein [Planctomycetota bacterium]|nr:MAG: histidine triad nucleotide-binding protein [Planctomycetota bacterium]